MEQTIQRQEAMRLIESGAIISLGFVTADRKRGTGGDYLEVKNWQKVGENLKVKSQPFDKLRVTTPKSDCQAEPVEAPNTRSPHHFENKTFNIHNPANRAVHIHKVHYRLFDRFNGATVIG